MNQYVKQYQQASIETASREQILIMLYDGAIQFLNKAKVSMSKNDIEGIHNNLMGAQNILNEFITSMDVEVAPQLAQNLISLYEYFIRRLVRANMKKEIEPIDEVLGYLKSLKATWEKAIALAQKEEMEKYKQTRKNIDFSDDYDSDEDGENSEEQEHLKRIKQELLESLKRVKLLENNIYGSTKENKEKEIKMNEKYKQQVIQSEKIKEEKSTKEIEQERE